MDKIIIGVATVLTLAIPSIVGACYLNWIFRMRTKWKQ